MDPIEKMLIDSHNASQRLFEENRADVADAAARMQTFIAVGVHSVGDDQTAPTELDQP